MAKLFWILALIFMGRSDGQFIKDISDANNIFDALTKTLTCGQFQTLIQGAGLQTVNLFKSQIRLTLFVPNNTAFQQIPLDKQNAILNMSPSDKEDYVRFYTVNEEIQTLNMNNNIKKKSMSTDNNRLFFNQIKRRIDDIGGNAGVTEFYVNGALIIRPNVRAGNGIVHVIDRVLEKSYRSNAYAFLRRPDETDQSKQTEFFKKFINYLTGEYINNCVDLLQKLEFLTLFLPSDEAVNKIPVQKLNELQSEQPRLQKVIQQHIIKSQAIYTSFVNHNEGFNAVEGRNIFRKTVGDSVYISGGRVTAEIIRGNITVVNGAVHYIDTVLGFVYNTARDQIQQDSLTRQFEDLTNRGRKELQDFLVRPTGVTVFCPTNDAFNAIANIPNSDVYNNATLIDEVLQRSFLEPGSTFDLTKVNGNYDSKFMVNSQFRGKKVKIYSQGNDTWVEGGYVKARVIRPDIGVTNGIVHYIDGVFGVPSRDLPGVIYCEDWLIKPYYVLSTVGLDKYLRDSRITTAQRECPPSLARRQFGTINNNNVQNDNNNNNNNGNNYNYNAQTNNKALRTTGCGASGVYCEFTMFVPNGTAIDNFQKTELGLRIMGDNNRLRHVLRRHILKTKRLYLDTLSPGSHAVVAETGETLRINKIDDKYIEILYGGQRTKVLHSDIGATNGVIHIVDRVLHVNDDLTREINSAQNIYNSSMVICILILFLFYSVL